MDCQWLENGKLHLYITFPDIVSKCFWANYDDMRVWVLHGDVAEGAFDD